MVQRPNITFFKRQSLEEPVIEVVKLEDPGNACQLHADIALFHVHDPALTDIVDFRGDPAAEDEFSEEV